MSEESIEKVEETVVPDADVQVNTADNEKDSELYNLADKSLKEIIDFFSAMVERGDQQEMFKCAEIVKASFYKALKRDKIASGASAEEQVVDTGVPEEGQETAPADNPFAQIERGFKELYASYRAKRNAYIAEQDKIRQENLAAKLQIIEELKAMVEKQEDVNKTFPEFRALQKRWHESGPVPPQNTKNIYETYQHCVEMFYDYVKINNELRDLDFKKNLEIKEKLCEQAEALMEEEKIVNAFNTLQRLHEEWKELGPVDKEHRELIWERFKVATAQINKKYQAFFEGMKEQQKDNLDKKTALCEKAEELAGKECADTKEWNAATKEMEALQTEWRGIGYASKKENQKIYDRFRAACDAFFEKKREHYSQFKDQLTQNLEAKEALCVKAEALMNSTDWKAATDAIIALQKEWKTVGPAPRKNSDEVWNRFRAACDAFFNNKEKNHGGADPQHVKNLEEKQAISAEVSAYKLKGDRNADLNAMRNFISRWNNVGFVPFKEKDAVQDAFKKALDATFPDFRNMSDSDRRGGGRNGNGWHGFSNDKLLQKYHKLESEIATYENNLGFFARSKNADAFISEINKKIEAAKKELAEIEAKIKEVAKN